MNTSTNTTFRIFTPIILFNDTKEGLCIDNELLEIKKQKVNAMLKSNVQFWNHIIETTNNKSDDDDTTASSHSSTLDESPPILNKKKCNNGRRRRGNLPKNVTAILKQWLIDHRGHPYPTEEEKRSLRMKTNLTLNQISNWFINARRRILPSILSQEKKK